jgi:biopolymer transport protein ExbD
MRRKALSPPAKPPLTPLIDIAFLVLIFFMSLPLRRLDGKLAAFLPKGVGIENAPAPEPEPTVEIRVLRRGDDHVYRLGQHTAPDPKGLEPTLRALGADNRYEIYGNPDVEWEAIVKVTDLLAGLKFTQVRFTGTRRPTTEQRRLLRLPAPTDDS